VSLDLHLRAKYLAEDLDPNANYWYVSFVDPNTVVGSVIDHVHDPSQNKAGGGYYSFCGVRLRDNIPKRFDMMHWSKISHEPRCSTCAAGYVAAKLQSTATYNIEAW